MSIKISITIKIIQTILTASIIELKCPHQPARVSFKDGRGMIILGSKEKHEQEEKTRKNQIAKILRNKLHSVSSAFPFPPTRACDRCLT